jgi:hypothetical protein
MKTFNHYTNRLMALLLLVSIFAACEKDTKEAFKPSRLFAPGRISTTPRATNVKLEWDASLYATDTVTYVVEVSKDSLFAGTPVYTTEVKTDSVIITDQQLLVRQKYFARVKAKGIGQSAESNWQYSPSFGILGEQFFLPIVDTDLKDKSVILKWKITPGLTRILIGPVGGSPTQILLDAADLAAGQKLITGLTAKTLYLAELLQGSLSKGTITFTTKEPSLYTVELIPTDNLVTAVANAANGDVIGLKPGTYDCVDMAAAWANLVITQKSITIQSISNNPADTKVNFKEVTLKGTGAGVTLKGITFDGAPGTGVYFLNLTGLNADADAATFTDITVDNCIVKNMGNCFFRGNRGNAAGDHKISSIKVNNTIASNSSTGSTYIFFTMEKLQFAKLELTNSTFHSMGRGFIVCGTTLTVKPTILVNQCTINNFGSGGTSRNYTILDANANPVDLTIQNSIIANTPIAGQTIGPSALRATGGGSVLLFANNNTFNLTNGATPAVALTFPAALTMQSNKTINLGWNETTVDFKLPAGSELLTSSTTNGPIGDPRWAQ